MSETKAVEERFEEMKLEFLTQMAEKLNRKNDDCWTAGYQNGAMEIINALGLKERQVIELFDKILCGPLNCRGAELPKQALIRLVAQLVAGMKTGTVDSMERFGVRSV